MTYEFALGDRASLRVLLKIKTVYLWFIKNTQAGINVKTGSSHDFEDPTLLKSQLV